MQFYPHKTSVNKAATAVSASIALTGSLINNFSAIAINRILTASVALNITGSRGTDGTSVAVIGPTGLTGPRGETGYRGRNIFLLSSSWTGSASTCGQGPAPVCYGAYTLNNVTGGTICSRGTQGIYYTNYGPQNLRLVTDNAADGSILFTDSTCTAVAPNITAHNGYRVLYTDGAGVISSVECGTIPEPVCNGPYTLYDSSPVEGGGYTCDGTNNPTQYYTNYSGTPELTGLSGTDAVQANGFILYTQRVDGVCSTPATNLTKHNGNSAAFTTDGSGVITYGTCST